jgi:hypothetical protein
MRNLQQITQLSKSKSSIVHKINNSDEVHKDHIIPEAQKHKNILGQYSSLYNPIINDHEKV